MALRRLVVLTIAVAAGCYAHSQPAYYPGYESPGVCDYYGKYGPRSSYYYAPGTDLGVPRGAPPNDHLYYGGGPTIGYGYGYGYGYGGAPLLYGPMPPGYCPPEK